MRPTLVFLHAHPDDEALLTAGTMARASAEGCRVVLVTATAGEAGLADPAFADRLGGIRVRELERSARILGVQRLEVLGYADSGLDGHSPAGDATPFTAVAAPEVADRVAVIAAEEAASVLVTYDASGGYGHPDHRHVHAVGTLLARRLPELRVFEATAPRWPFAVGVRAAGAVGALPAGFDPTPFEQAFTPSAAITHRVDVRDYADFKRAALRAHASQSTGGDVRTLAALLRLPRPLFRAALGTEYYRQERTSATARVSALAGSSHTIRSSRRNARS